MKAKIAKGQKTLLAIGFEFSSKKECRAFIKELKERLKTIKPKAADFAFLFDVDNIDMYYAPKPPK